MAENKSWWTQVKLKPELVPFIVLSPREVHEYTVEAAKAADPVAKLTELLHAKGQAKKLVREALNAERMRVDRQRIVDSSAWPDYPYLPLKSQPWITETNMGIPKFGYINEANRLVVMDKPNGHTLKVYRSLDELVKDWSVD